MLATIVVSKTFAKYGEGLLLFLTFTRAGEGFLLIFFGYGKAIPSYMCPKKCQQEDFGHIKREYLPEKAPTGRFRSHKVVEAKNIMIIGTFL
ncbi:hypothetical protein J7E38_11790 [Bacillus sp. ISL-35]|uniref:hypothetical protein n=1 Tax=Bacillus sp. ISL-35 TaxID=2819122 RepID=UPI001BEA59E0|nr:hypothetical protein [Bacillus sp. ISL-35]MBT2679685.1 hypothetical protein [Bacillus sp. ISL-35]MBT2704718.1 hypothetical protein [Chryseobacterium sp. ISL-80]